MLNNENYGYLVHPLTQFMDANLKPLTSAYLKVFYAGTSASAYTYSDWEGTLNVSDIRLSMNGSTNVIAEKNKAYKVMLCDALHPPSDPIWVKDNLYVINSEMTVASGVTTTVSEITENATVTLVAGQNRYLNCTNSPTISVEIADNNIYHIQINGSCTLALTGVSWCGDAITAITTKAEISILNGIAIGVLYE